MELLASEMSRTDQTHKVLRVTSDYVGAFQVIAPDFFVLPPATDSKEDCFSRLYAMGHDNIIA
jgi:hypothetical protein